MRNFFYALYLTGWISSNKPHQTAPAMTQRFRQEASHVPPLRFGPADAPLTGMPDVPRFEEVTCIRILSLFRDAVSVKIYNEVDSP